MFDAFLDFMCHHAPVAHYYLFGLLLLAGVNIPVSEDLILIAGGILVAIFSTWLLYSLGYRFGDNYQILLGYVYTYHHIAIVLVGGLLGAGLCYLWYHHWYRVRL